MNALKWAPLALLTLCACNNETQQMMNKSGPPAGACTKDTKTGGCRCLADAVGRTLQLDEVAVDNCDAPPSGVTWSCCHDVGSTGITTFCGCGVSMCAQRNDAYICGCDYLFTLSVGGSIDEYPQPRGTETQSSTCTGDKCCTNGQACSCVDNFTSCQFSTTVSSCAPPTSHSCPGGELLSNSCAGLKWAQ